MDPLVSVLTPTYNSQRFIGRAIESVLAQTYTNFEMLIVDSLSQDGTADVVRTFRDARVIFLQEKGLSVGAARNHAFRRSRGDYITFLDSDDIFQPQKIERQVDFLRRHPAYDVAYCNGLHRYENAPDVLYRKRRDSRSGNIVAQLLQTSYINLNTVLLKRAVLDKAGVFNERRGYPEDWELWLKIGLAGFSFGYHDEDLVIHEIRPDSDSNTWSQALIKSNAVKMFQALLSDFKRVGMEAAASAVLRKHRLKLAMAFLMNRQSKDFLKEFVACARSKALAGFVGDILIAVPPWALKRLWNLNRRNSLDSIDKNS